MMMNGLKNNNISDSWNIVMITASSINQSINAKKRMAAILFFVPF